MAKKSSYNKLIKYKVNPFLEEGTQTISTRKRHVLVGRGDSILLHPESGEVEATNIMAVREVDDAQFIKLFTQNIGLMMGFNAAGIKALGFLMWAVQRYAMRKDIVQLDTYTREEFVNDNDGLVFSERTMYQGIPQLIDAKIIARHVKPGFYFINPNFIFNGDRVRFITEIRRKKVSKTEELEAAGQMRLIG